MVCSAASASSRAGLAASSFSSAIILSAYNSNAVSARHTTPQDFSNVCVTLTLLAGSNGTVSVRLSVPAWAHSSKPATAGLLLWARQAGDIDRLLQQRRAVGMPRCQRIYVAEHRLVCNAQLCACKVKLNHCQRFI